MTTEGGDSCANLKEGLLQAEESAEVGGNKLGCHPLMLCGWNRGVRNRGEGEEGREVSRALAAREATVEC